MNTQNIQCEDDRRCSAGELDKMLQQLPMKVNLLPPSAKLSARMGLGKIVYLSPIEGSVCRIIPNDGIIIDAPRSSSGSLVFEYSGQRFDLSYQ